MSYLVGERLLEDEMLRPLATRRQLALSLCLGLAGISLAARGQAPRSTLPTVIRSLANKARVVGKRSSPGRPRLTLAQLTGEGAAARPPVRLTLDARLQQAAREALLGQAAPLGAVVVLDVASGRVLALEGRQRQKPERWAPELALTAWAPAASVFKVVTAAALVERGVSPVAPVCYHGGVRSVDASNLVPHPRLDTTCHDLAFGIAKSQNAILARLAHEHLAPATLAHTARALGFGAALDFELPVAASRLDIPTDPLGFAQTAAGFWRTSLSPLHGAYLAALIAREGVAPPLHLVAPERLGDRAPAPAPRRVLPRETARAVADMMVGTTEYGTARRGFHDRRGRPYLDGIAVGGKTGTLSGWLRPDALHQGPSETPTPGAERLAYSWFVGFAPAAQPTVAIAVLLGNDEPWRPRAHQLSEKVLAAYFEHQRTTLVAQR